MIASTEDLGEMLHIPVSHQGLHFLLTLTYRMLGINGLISAYTAQCTPCALRLDFNRIL